MITPQEGYDENDLATLEGTLTLDTTKIPSDIIFFQTENNNEILKLCHSGDIYVKGKLVENDMEVVEGMRELLSLNGLYK